MESQKSKLLRNLYNDFKNSGKLNQTTFLYMAFDFVNNLVLRETCEKSQLDPTDIRISDLVWCKKLAFLRSHWKKLAAYKFYHAWYSV